MNCGTESPWKTGFFELLGRSEPRLDVPWEPSPAHIVNEMISLAQVRSTDVVYDLGCGDGRAVITAAKRTGARAVGVDLDPQRIKECHENGVREEANGLVRFLNADLFETDVSEASVLFLFLFPHVNRRLRPKLLAELSPGTRIVSYCHDMEEWQPDHRIKVRTNYLYLWILPANVGGRWEGAIREERRRPLRLELQQEFQMVSGMVSFGDKVLFVRNARLEGDAFRFGGPERSDESGNGSILSGSVKGEVIEGVIQADKLPGETVAWTARRDPSTRSPLGQ